jgi:hypothetical protein
MVAFVAICLLGAAVILIGRYSADPEGANPSPASSSRVSASASAQETSRPSPTPRVVAVVPGDVPPSSDPGNEYSRELWIRAQRDLVIRDFASVTGRQVGVLKKGEAAVLEQDPGSPVRVGGYEWVLIQQPEPTGWIAAGTATSTFIDRYPWPIIPASGLIDHLIAGDGRYVAVGAEPRTQDQPPSWFIASSTDGRTWQRSSTTLVGSEPAQVAWGPTGWLAMSHVADGQPWLWRSQDANHWTSGGSLGSMRSDLTSLTGSVLGYMISGSGRGGPRRSGIRRTASHGWRAA